MIDICLRYSYLKDYFTIHLFIVHFQMLMAHLAGAVDYADCISAEC